MMSSPSLDSLDGLAWPLLVGIDDITDLRISFMKSREKSYFWREQFNEDYDDYDDKSFNGVI